MIGTYDGAQVRLYIDGVRVASDAGTGTINSSSGYAFSLGRYNGGGLAFVGSLDEFAISPSVLSELDIASRVYGQAILAVRLRRNGPPHRLGHRPQRPGGRGQHLRLGGAPRDAGGRAR